MGPKGGRASKVKKREHPSTPPGSMDIDSDGEGRPRTAGIQQPASADATTQQSQGAGEKTPRQLQRSKEQLEARKARTKKIFDAASHLSQFLQDYSNSERTEILKLVGTQTNVVLTPMRSAPVVISAQDNRSGSAQPASVEARPNKRKVEPKPPQKRADWKLDPEYRSVLADREAFIKATKVANGNFADAAVRQQLDQFTVRLKESRESARKRFSA